MAPFESHRAQVMPLDPRIEVVTRFLSEMETDNLQKPIRCPVIGHPKNKRRMGGIE